MYIYWLTDNHNIYIIFYKVIFIKSFYKVVTEARFARRPTGGRPYTHSIQKNNQIIVCPEMSWILFHIILYYTILYLLSILYKKIFESLTEYNILYKIYIKLNCILYWLIYNHNIFILFYKVIFIKSFYKVVTKARFARRPTEGRPYTLTIQKK